MPQGRQMAKTDPTPQPTSNGKASFRVELEDDDFEGLRSISGDMPMTHFVRELFRTIRDTRGTTLHQSGYMLLADVRSKLNGESP